MNNLAIVPKEGLFGKSFLNRIFVPFLIILSSLLSFGIGRYTKVRGEPEPVTIEQVTLSTNPGIDSMEQKAGVSQKEEGAVVASKNGSKYHLPSCPGAGQIKEENKVWFESSAAALAAGYSPAANCPGLK